MALLDREDGVRGGSGRGWVPRSEGDGKRVFELRGLVW